ncbi:MAG: hypothetical protein A4E58_02999 [Syntrophorhabdus sp. PtaB.Bin006]|nr:MAG: hypothetical protein A4E58_02999 [Syntrophorhabdus sp. PtaB.Bin006]
MEQMSSLSFQASIKTSGAITVDLVEELFSVSYCLAALVYKDNGKTNKIDMQV